MAFQNIYAQRKVADTSSRPCEICYKPSAIVLTTSENTDYFYVCSSHLKDKGFCSPIVDEAAVAAKKNREVEADREMKAEIEKLKREFEEKQAKKKGNEKEKANDKDKKDDDAKKDDKTKSTAKVQPTVAPKEEPVPQPDAGPRVFALQRTFYQQRLDKKRNAEIAKRNRERLQNPNFFPAVPKGLP